jgi:transposase
MHLVDPFVPRLKALWAEGHRNAKHLWRMIRSEGFKGSSYAVRRCVAPWRTAEERVHVSGRRTTRRAIPPLVRPSSNRLAWLLARPELPRQPEETRLVELLKEACEPVAMAARLTREFGDAIASRDLVRMKQWVQTATTSEVVPKDVASFATGIARDWHEVSAAVEHPYSNGRTEGHVNRLKMIKRKMYGRAKFDLLRIRVLASGP